MSPVGKKNGKNTIKNKKNLSVPTLFPKKGGDKFFVACYIGRERTVLTGEGGTENTRVTVGHERRTE